MHVQDASISDKYEEGMEVAFLSQYGESSQSIEVVRQHTSEGIVGHVAGVRGRGRGGGREGRARGLREEELQRRGERPRRN